MFKRILVALDGSPASNAGFASALQLAKDQHASLVALHLIDDVAMTINLDAGYLPPSYVDTLYDSLRKNGEEILAKAQSAARAVDVPIVSNAEAVLRDATVPVLLVRMPASRKLTQTRKRTPAATTGAKGAAGRRREPGSASRA